MLLFARYPRCFFLLPAMALLLAAPAHAQQPAPEAERSQCFGRFCVQLPAAWQRAGENHEIRDVAIEEKRWANPQNRERSREFDLHLQAAAAQAARIGTAIIEKREQPQRAVLFQRYENPFLATWGALLAKGPVDLWLLYDAELTASREMPARLAEVGDAYRPNELGGAAREANQFQLRFGSLRLPYKGMETSRVHFENPAQKISLTFAIASINEPQPQTLQEKLSANTRLLAAVGRDVKVQKAQVRFAGGMVGEELITRSTEGGVDVLSFKWRYSGDLRNEQKPRLLIQLDTGVEQAAEKQAQWNRLLDTLRPAAQQSAPAK